MLHARQDYNRFQDPDGKIPADEPVFLLRAQDPDAANAVRAYAALIQARGADSGMVQICRDWANKMDAWPTKKAVADI